MFGSQPAIQDSSRGNPETGNSDFDTIRLQRAAKRARFMAAPSTPAPLLDQQDEATPIPAEEEAA